MQVGVFLMVVGKSLNFGPAQLSTQAARRLRDSKPERSQSSQVSDTVRFWLFLCPFFITREFVFVWSPRRRVYRRTSSGRSGELGNLETEAADDAQTGHSYLPATGKQTKRTETAGRRRGSAN